MQVKGTLHSKLTLGFFSWPKNIYYCDLSIINCTFVKLELSVQGTHFYGDAGEFDGRCGIDLGPVISRNRQKARSESGVHSYENYGIAAIKSVNKIKVNVSNNMCRNNLDYHISVW